jgi:hypothetical protein
MTALITATEYIQLTNDDVTATLPGPYVEAILGAVSADVQVWLGTNLGSATYTDEATTARAVTYNRQPCLRVAPLYTPITAISALAIWYAVESDPTAIGVDDAVIEAGGTSVLVPFGVFGLWTTFFQIGERYRARMTYTAGEALPDDVKLGIALLAQELLAMQSETSHKGADTATSFKIGDYSETKAARDLSASQGLGLGTQLSVRAAQILGRHRKQGVTFL